MIVEKGQMETEVRGNHCPGSDRELTKEELADQKRVKDKWGYPVTRYKCKDCGKYYTKEWGKQSFTRHGYKLDDPAEKAYRAAKRAEKERAEAERKRKRAEEAEKKRIAQLLAEGKVCFCAECDGYIIDMMDYLCAKCRANM